MMTPITNKLMSHPLDLQCFSMPFTEARFAALLKSADQLHDAASEDALIECSPLNREEIIGWLRDIQYTLGETIQELETASAHEGGCNA